MSKFPNEDLSFNCIISKKDEKFTTIKTKFSKSSNEVDSEGNNLSEQQARFFKESKVVDENADLLAVYHGTTWNFTLLKKKKQVPKEIW